METSAQTLKITMPEDAVVETQDEDFKDGDKMEGVEPQPELEPSPPPLPAPESPIPPTQPSQQEEKGIDDSPETKCVVIEDSPVPFKKGLTDEEIHASIRDMEKKLAGLKRVRIAQILSYFCFPHRFSICLEPSFLTGCLLASLVLLSSFATSYEIIPSSTKDGQGSPCRIFKDYTSPSLR